MKILEIDEFYSEQGGGVRAYTDQKLAACAQLGHETIIIAPGKENREDIVPGGKIVWIKAPRIPVDPRYHMFVSRGAIDAVIEKESPDVLVGASPWRGGWIAGQWQSPTGRCKPLKVLFMHADPMAVYAYTFLGGVMSQPAIDKSFSWFWSYLRRLSGKFDITLVASSWLAQRFSSYGLKDVQPVPFGVEVDLFKPELRDGALRASLLAACGLPETATLALTVGRHHPEKRLDTVIRAIAEANKSRPVGLYMAGDGLIRKSVEKWAASVPHVLVAGQIGDRGKLARIMASADIMVHGSGAETYGKVIAEALASGLPVVVPDQGGAADFAGPLYAETYKTGDAKDGARAILEMCERNRLIASSAAVRMARAQIGSDFNHYVRLYDCFSTLLSVRDVKLAA